MEAAKLLKAATAAGNVDAEVEYAIRRYSTAVGSTIVDQAAAVGFFAGQRVEDALPLRRTALPACLSPGLARPWTRSKASNGHLTRQGDHGNGDPEARRNDVAPPPMTSFNPGAGSRRAFWFKSKASVLTPCVSTAGILRGGRTPLSRPEGFLICPSFRLLLNVMVKRRPQGGLGSLSSDLGEIENLHEGLPEGTGPTTSAPPDHRAESVPAQGELSKARPGRGLPRRRRRCS